MSSALDYDMPYGYAIGLMADSTISHLGCSSCGIEMVPSDSDFVDVWTPWWDYYWAGAVKEDGSVVMWGCDQGGNLDVPEDLGPVQTAVGGWYWSLALLQDGTLRSWGRNDYDVITNTPNLSGVVEIAAGIQHGLALTDDGVCIRGEERLGACKTCPRLMVRWSRLARDHTRRGRLQRVGVFTFGGAMIQTWFQRPS